MGQLGVPQAGGREAAGRGRRVCWYPLRRRHAAIFSPLNGKPAPAFALEAERQKGFARQLQGQGGAGQLLGHLVRPCRIETPWLVELRNNTPRRALRCWASTPRATTAEERQGRLGQGQGRGKQVCRGHEGAVSGAARRRLDQPRLRRARRSAYVVLRGSQGNSGGRTGGTDLGERIEGNIKKALRDQ